MTAATNVFRLPSVHRKYRTMFKATAPAMMVLAELPCKEYKRSQADYLAARERKQHIASVCCSRVVLASGVPVWRVFIYVGGKL